jgi:hypothetical protein
LKAGSNALSTPPAGISSERQLQDWCVQRRYLQIEAGVEPAVIAALLARRQHAMREWMRAGAPHGGEIAFVFGRPEASARQPNR